MVVEWSWRAFREADKRDASIRVLSLGAMEHLFVTRRGEKPKVLPEPERVP